MPQSSVTTLLKFLSLLISEIFTIDKNRDGNVTALEIIGAALIILGKSQELAYVFNNIGSDFKAIKNVLENENDEFDKLVNEITELDFLPDDKQSIEDAIRKTLLALIYIYDAGLAWVETGTKDAPDADMSRSIAKLLKIDA